MFLFDDKITRGLHILAANIAYIIYFVWECVESTEYFDTFHAREYHYSTTVVLNLY